MFVVAAPRMTDGTGGWDRERLVAGGDGSVRFSQPEASAIVRYIRAENAPPEGMRLIVPPDGWEEEDNPYYGYRSDCRTEGEVFPSPNHYRRHRATGEEPCQRAEAEAEMYSEFAEDEEYLPPGWKPYRGKKAIKDLFSTPTRLTDGLLPRWRNRTIRSQ